jgi:hypothetical protein
MLPSQRYGKTQKCLTCYEIGKTLKENVLPAYIKTSAVAAAAEPTLTMEIALLKTLFALCIEGKISEI